MVPLAFKVSANGNFKNKKAKLFTKIVLKFQLISAVLNNWSILRFWEVMSHWRKTKLYPQIAFLLGIFCYIIILSKQFIHVWEFPIKRMFNWVELVCLSIINQPSSFKTSLSKVLQSICLWKWFFYMILTLTGEPRMMLTFWKPSITP